MLSTPAQKRETRVGQWAPVVFYAVNWSLWLLTGVWAGAWGLLWLAILPLPLLGLYLWRTCRRVR